jgi:hypothetical protein
MPAAKNLIVIMSDEHNPKVAGYAGRLHAVANLRARPGEFHHRTAGAPAPRLG